MNLTIFNSLEFFFNSQYKKRAYLAFPETKFSKIDSTLGYLKKSGYHRRATINLRYRNKTRA